MNDVNMTSATKSKASKYHISRKNLSKFVPLFTQQYEVLARLNIFHHCNLYDTKYDEFPTYENYICFSSP